MPWKCELPVTSVGRENEVMKLTRTSSGGFHLTLKLVLKTRLFISNRSLFISEIINQTRATGGTR